MVCSIIFVYGEFPDNTRANNIKIELVSNNMKIKLFTRKIGSFVNPPTVLIPPNFYYSILLYLFSTLTATETHLCYGGVVFHNFLCGGINRKDPKDLVFKSIHNAKDIH